MLIFGCRFVAGSMAILFSGARCPNERMGLLFMSTYILWRAILLLVGKIC